MRRLALEMDRLRVESFTTAEHPGGRGTVAAHAAASGHPDCTNVYLCTLGSCLPVCAA
jgi:hypothetical protein